jgi:hypothetical protein
VSLAPGNYWLAYLPSESGFKYPTQDGVGSFVYHPYDYNPIPDALGDLTMDHLCSQALMNARARLSRRRRDG